MFSDWLSRYNHILIGILVGIYIGISSHYYDKTISELRSTIATMNDNQYGLEKDYNDMSERERVLESLLDAFIDIEVNTQIEKRKIYEIMENKSLDMADIVYRAAKEYDVDPLLLVLLINSESSFNPNIKHDHPEVKGLGGIHHRYWKVPNETVEEQIYATAKVYSIIASKYDNIVDGLKAYKGWSQVGENRAKALYSKYITIKEKYD